MKKFLVTIDGPSGVGKTSVGKSIATKLNSCFFSSGSLYRSVAKFLLNNKNVQIEDLKIEIVSNSAMLMVSFLMKKIYTTMKFR